jgi:hypothetical protein
VKLRLWCSVVLIPLAGAGLFAPTSTRAQGDPPVADVVPQGVRRFPLDVHAFRVVERFSGDVDYYNVVDDPGGAFIQSVYRPPLATVTLGAEIPEELRHSAKRLRWRWRARVLPEHGNECQDGKTDSAAVVYAQWKSGLKWYSLKYVWSTEAQMGAVCRQKRNLFVAMDTIVLRSGGPLDTWVTEEIDPSFEFRKHFRDGDPNAKVPDFVGIGLLSDGDQTHSVSSSDYGGFEILY